MRQKPVTSSIEGSVQECFYLEGRRRGLLARVYAVMGGNQLWGRGLYVVNRIRNKSFRGWDVGEETLLQKRPSPTKRFHVQILSLLWLYGLTGHIFFSGVGLFPRFDEHQGAAGQLCDLWLGYLIVSPDAVALMAEFIRNK